jgi:hypothetical protein
MHTRIQHMRRYPDVDICALCQFLANALRAGESLDLLVLKELVETLTGIAVDGELSGEQVGACVCERGGGGRL